MIYQLRLRFGADHETIATALNLKAAQDYITVNKVFMHKCQHGITLHELKQFVANGGDLNFTDSQGNSCLTYLDLAAPAVYSPETFALIQKVLIGWIAGIG